MAAVLDASEVRGGGGVGRVIPEGNYGPRKGKNGKNYTGGTPHNIANQAKGVSHHGSEVLPIVNNTRGPD